MRRNRWTKRHFLLLGLVLLAVLAALYAGGRWLEGRELKPDEKGDYRQRLLYDQTIEVNGEVYRKRKDVTSILLMGVDKETDDVAVARTRSGGQADFLRLLILDAEQKKLTQLAIDRDTVTPITTLGILGNRSGVRTAQISLSHSFGDGGEQSCLLTQEAVSNLLLGTDIDFYMALTMDGIAALNDAAGGVTVTLKDDFSHEDPEMTPGKTMTLRGDQARIFTRSRMRMAEGTNAARMERQQQFINALLDQTLEKVREDKEFIGTLFDTLLPYLVTNMPRGRMINEAWAAREYERLPAVSIAGEHRVAPNGYMEFHADEADIEKKVLELFYRHLQ